MKTNQVCSKLQPSEMGCSSAHQNFQTVAQKTLEKKQTNKNKHVKWDLFVVSVTLEVKVQSFSPLENKAFFTFQYPTLGAL